MVLTASLAVCMPLAVGGCSADGQVTPASTPASAPASGPAVTKDALDRELVDSLAQKTGLRPDLVNCPSDLPRAIGATVNCEIIKAGHRVGTATVTLDDGAHVHVSFDIDLSTLPGAR